MPKFYEPVTVILPDSSLKELSKIYNRLAKYGIVKPKIQNEFWVSDTVELCLHHYASNCLLG